jgi:hypothetical protein
MSDPKSDKSVQPGNPGKAAPEESESMRQLDRDADQMAQKADEEEERYDEDHPIFDK